VKSNVAKRIRLERLRQNLSQQNIADDLGITVAAYSNLERGVSDITLSRLFQLASIFNKSIHWFFEDDVKTVHEVQGVRWHNRLNLLIQDVDKLKIKISRIEELLTKKGS
jgi:transcriptional regulator with XRE-family HTH domain